MSSTSSRERHEFWQQHIDAWQASDLSGAAFCKQHDQYSDLTGIRTTVIPPKKQQCSQVEFSISYMQGDSA